MITNYNQKFVTHDDQIRGKVYPKKLSICIPYKKRLENIEITFEALAHQTMNKDDFEVIVGAMDYCEKFISLTKKYIEKLNIISVISPDEFAIPLARNLAMRQATGQIIIQIDADTLLLPDSLQNLYNGYFAFGQKVCIVGQVVGYDNNSGESIEKVETHSYTNYQYAIRDLEKSIGSPKDPRFQVYHAIPWAFGWTGFIAIPLKAIQEHDLYFDETFVGWGVDDLEWSYRICKAGIPIVLSENIRAIHLPHARDSENNRKTEAQNYHRFLLKWPLPDVELAHYFGDMQANALYFDFITDRKKVFSTLKGHLGVIKGIIGGNHTLIVGVELNNMNQIIDSEISHQFDTYTTFVIYPLIGMGLPFNDKEFDECRVLHPISLFTKRYTSAVYQEVHRVSKKVVLFQELNL